MASKFWEILESDFSFEIPKHIKNAFELDGYANALSFQGITDEQIERTEQFVREEMYNYLIRTTAEAINEKDESFLTDDDDVLITKEQLIDHFGKVYATDPSNFRFLSGEVVLIKEMVKHVKGKLGSQQENGLKLFQTRNRTKKTNNFSTKCSLSEPNVEKLTSELSQKVIECMESYEADQFFDSDLENVMHDKTVDVRMKKGVGVYGMIYCEICNVQNKKGNRPKRVYYNENSKWPCWVLSNFTKHLKNAHNLKSRGSKTQKSKASESLPNEQIENEQNDSDVIFVVEETIDVPIEESTACDQTNENDEKITIFAQFTQQINIMMSAVLENSDAREGMGFMINKSMQTLNVANIAPDGNCLFSSLAHQLFQDKINSKPHLKQTRQLRSRVVAHILNPANFPKYMHELKNRVFENKKKNEIENMEAECKLWVSLCLSKAKVWGGTETIYAVSEIEKVNIIIFNENDEFYQLRNTKIYQKSVCIAYRLPRDEEGEIVPGERNHYDSVFDINSTTLYDVARIIEERHQ